jgi:hypothetical protein
MGKTSAWDSSSPEERPDGKLLVPDCTVLTVKIIEDETEYLHTGLGISNKEAKRLQRLMQDIIETGKARDKRGNNIANILVELSTHCVHANQLAFVAFALGRSTGHNDRRPPPEDLMKMLFGGMRPDQD